MLFGQAIGALLDAISTYDGALVVISHDRPFCEAIEATHIGYICDGGCVVEERELRDSDFSEADRGVRNTFVAPADGGGGGGGDGGSSSSSSGPPPPPMSPEEAKAFRAAERSARKVQNAAPKKQEKLEVKIVDAEVSGPTTEPPD